MTGSTLGKRPGGESRVKTSNTQWEEPAPPPANKPDALGIPDNQNGPCTFCRATKAARGKNVRINGHTHVTISLLRGVSGKGWVDSRCQYKRRRTRYCPLSYMQENMDCLMNNPRSPLVILVQRHSERPFFLEHASSERL